MKLVYQIKNENGFTIQEILVVLIVGSILVSLSLALFQFTNELFQMWYGTNELKSDMNRIMHAMALDIQRSNDVIEKTDTTLVLSRGIGWTVTYSLSDNSLKRNEVDLTPQKKKSFRVKIEDMPKGIGSARSFHIKLFAQSRWSSYESEIIAMIAQSSKAGF
jgi:prepilin-type N-terminal cleavage/methylation domain-containing protein